MIRIAVILAAAIGAILVAQSRDTSATIASVAVHSPCNTQGSKESGERISTDGRRIRIERKP